MSASSNPALAMRRKKHTEKEVHADLVSIVSVRLREGYSIREVNITKGDKDLNPLNYSFLEKETAGTKGVWWKCWIGQNYDQ